VLEAVILQIHRAQVALLSDHTTEIAIALFANQSQLQADSVILRARALTFYYILFVVSLFFQLVLYVDAIYNKNTIQIIGLMLFHFLTLGYCVIQILQARSIIATPKIAVDLHDMVPDFQADATLPYGVTVAVLMTAFVLVWVYVNWKLFQEFGWQIFKQIGADLRMRRMYMIYQIFVTILKFDMFMLLAFSTQWLIMLVDQAEQQGSSSYGDYSQVIIHSIVSCGGSVVMLVLAYWAVRTERRWAMVTFIIADLATVGYFISKIVAMQPPWVTIGVQCIPNWPPETCDRYDGSRNFFTLFLTVDIALGLVTAAVAARALLNFNHGLLPHVTLRRRPGWQGASPYEDGTALCSLEGQQHKRWTID